MSRGGFFRPRLIASSRRHGRLPDDADRFRLVMLPHMDAAYRFACYLARDGTAAEDIVQDAFLRAFRSFASWRGDNPRAWLLAIVRNCHFDSVSGRHDPLRGAEPVEAIAECDAQTVEGPETSALRRSDSAMLRRTIGNLPEPFRETIILRELEELSYKEIAAITQVPIGTVMSRLARARAMLGALLLPNGAVSHEVRS